MPRPPRDLAPGIQHIGVSAAGPANYFRDEIDHLTWTRLLVRTLARHGWVCVAMCQLSTHWHALVQIPDGSLACGMHELNSEYGKRFNVRHGRVGYLVRDRYWSRRKTNSDDVLTAFRYVVENPVKAGAVRRPEEWHWSTYATTIGLSDAFPFVDATIVLDELGPTQKSALAALRRLVEPV
jgi:REP-associated tyrosine transposase